MKLYWDFGTSRPRSNVYAALHEGFFTYCTVLAQDRTVLYRFDASKPLHALARRYTLAVAHLWEAPKVITGYLAGEATGLRPMSQTLQEVANLDSPRKRAAFWAARWLLHGDPKQAIGWYLSTLSHEERQTLLTTHTNELTQLLCRAILDELATTPNTQGRLDAYRYARHTHRALAYILHTGWCSAKYPDQNLLEQTVANPRRTPS